MKCGHCNRDMVRVPKGAPTPEGFVRHHGRGLCTTCSNRDHQARHRTGAPTETVKDNRRHLESWLHERRARGIPADGLVGTL